LKNKGDYQFGYGFSAAGAGLSDRSIQRKRSARPDQYLQHWISAQYQIRNNVTLGYTGWVGRTLNSSLQNAKLAPGLTAGVREPYLKRYQFDIVYKF
jgi:hypothetical protein